MWNLFRRPIEKSSFDSWAKISDDVAKVAMIALPTALLSNVLLETKVAYLMSLIVLIYLLLTTGRILRKKAEEKSK